MVPALLFDDIIGYWHRKDRLGIYISASGQDTMPAASGASTELKEKMRKKWERLRFAKRGEP
jgi:hypothetical protein